MSISALSPSASQQPLALVYRDKTISEGCADGVKRLLETSPRHFQVRYVGPGAAEDLTAESLNRAQLIAFPGGDDLDGICKRAKKRASLVRDFVSNGGRYLGFCLGAYMAGRNPGFGLLPKGSDTDSEIDQPRAQVRTDVDTIIQVDWTLRNGDAIKDRWIFFQEGAVIVDLPENENSSILARYSKDQGVAAAVTKYGKGWVGLTGPHPEATQDWFDNYNIHSPDGVQFELGYDLIEATMEGL